MLRYEELPYRYYMYDEFSPLNKLYPGNTIEMGYHGNMYQIILNSIRNMDYHAFFDATRYHLVLQELKEGRYVTIGEATFDGRVFYQEDSLELRSQIKSAIIQLNVKPTDYYK